MNVTKNAGVTARLNRNCFCITLDRAALWAALDREAGDTAFSEAFIKSRPYLFSNVPVFLSGSAVEEMQGIVDAIEAVRRQGFWDNMRFELAEALAHQGCHFMLPLLDEASGAV